jgi:sigma-54 specific flagellar transcriptional regulator A
VLLARGPFVEAEDILGVGAGAPCEVKARVAFDDPRREPEAVAAKEPSPPTRREVDFAAEFALAGQAFGVQDRAVPKSSPDLVTRAAVLPLSMPSMARHGSNPAFPRVLPDQGFDLFTAVESYQNHLIRQALSRTGGNKNKAAQLLGLNRTTLVEMIRRRGL